MLGSLRPGGIVGQAPCLRGSLLSRAVAYLPNALEADAGDVSVVVVSDSTADSTTDWPYYLAELLAAAYPAYTVEHVEWSTGSSAYAAATTVQTGSGANTLTIRCAAVSGASPYYVQSGRLAPMVTDHAPDLVMVAHGHNSPSSDTGDGFKSRYLQLVESIREVLPDTEVLCIAQNPQTTSSNMATRAGYVSDLCELMGYGFVNVEQAFQNYGDWEADLMSDSVHPNAAGGQFWAQTVMDAMEAAKGRSAYRGATPPVLRQAAPSNLIGNPEFADGSGNSFTGYSTLGTTTLTEDTVNVETGVRACKTTSAGGSSAGIRRTISSASSYIGRTLFLAARIYRHASAAGDASAGRVGIVTNTVTRISEDNSQLIEGWHWVMVMATPLAGTSSLQVYGYGDSATSTGVEITWDRWVLLPSLFPYDTGGE